MKSRHEILGTKIAAPKRILKSLRGRFLGIDNYEAGKNPGVLRRRDIDRTLGVLVMHHLGYTTDSDTEQIVQTKPIIDDFFCGTWWQTDRDFKSTASTKGAFRQGWLQVYAASAVICLLMDDLALLKKISSELNSGMKDSGVEFERLEADLYLSVASELSQQPFPEIVKNEQRLARCKNSRVKLLFESWQALRRKDRMLFASLFPASLEEHLLTWDVDVTFLRSFGCFETLLFLSAPKYEVMPPSLTAKQVALLLTRESTGLEAI